MSKRLFGVLVLALGLGFSGIAGAGKVKIKVQSVLPTKTDEIVMVKDLTENHGVQLHDAPTIACTSTFRTRSLTLGSELRKRRIPG